MAKRRTEPETAVTEPEVDTAITEVADAPLTAESVTELDESKLQNFHVLQIETFESFARRHGEFIQIGEVMETRPGHLSGRTILFEDGAAANSTDPVHHGGHEPSSDLQRLRNRCKFYMTKLQREKDARDRFHADCVQQAGWHLGNPNVPPPVANWREQLAAGDERISALSIKCGQLMEELKRTDPDLIRRRKDKEAREATPAQSQSQS